LKKNILFLIILSSVEARDYYINCTAGNDTRGADSGLLFFSVGAYGEANCTSNEHKVWAIIPLIILAGLMLYMLASIEAGIFGTIGFLITLVIELNLIISLINIVLTSC